MDEQHIVAEARIMEQILRARGKFRATLIPAPKVGKFRYFVSPFSVVYQLHIAESQRVADLVPLAEDFASFINRFRRENNLAPRQQTATVRFDTMNHTVEVSRINRGTLHPSDVVWDRKPMVAMLGQSQDFGGVFPILWNLDEPGEAHGLLAGASQRAGKTNQLLQILSSLTENTSPNDLRITIIDAKPSPDLREVEILPHVENDGVARDEENALRLARAFHREMRRRYDDNDFSGPRRFLIVEELATLTESEDKTFRDTFRKIIDDISRRCGESKMNLLVVTQKPTAEVLGSQLKGNLVVRIVGAVTSKDDSQTAVNMKQAGAEKLPGYGAFIWRLGPSMLTYQAPLIEDGNAEFARIAAKWTGRPVEVQTQHRAQPQQQVMRHRDDATGEVLEVVIKPDTSGYGADMTRLSGGYRPDMSNAQPVMGPDITGYTRLSGKNAPKMAGNLVSWPIGTFRPLEEHERAEVRRLARLPEYQHRGEPSMNKLCVAVYGSKSPERLAEVQRALQAQPIPLRPAQTAQRRHMRVVGGDD